jgi:hypothetical protein
MFGRGERRNRLGRVKSMLVMDLLPWLACLACGLPFDIKLVSGRPPDQNRYTGTSNIDGPLDDSDFRQPSSKLAIK